MKEIQNKTSRPIRVPLPGGKSLHIGPGMVGQVHDNAIAGAGLQKLVEEGSIEILGEGQRPMGSEGPGAGRQNTHGRTKSFRRGQGDR